MQACWFTEWSAYTEGREREEEETGHCRLGGCFNLGGLSDESVSAPAHRKLKGLCRGLDRVVMCSVQMMPIP